MARSKHFTYTRWLWLLPLPVLWAILAQVGALEFLENRFLDWRFRFRGEIDAPVKIIYVDVDSVSIDRMGNMPWSRAWYAQVCEALLGTGKAKAVGIDFVLGEKGRSKLIATGTYIRGNLRLQEFLASEPPVVIAASFSADEYLDINRELANRQLPEIAKGLPPIEQIEPPELPGFEIADKQMASPPFIGLIDTLHGGTRWIPAFAPTSWRTYHHMAIELARFYYGVGIDGIKIADDHLDLVRPDGTLATRIPLAQRQMVEINWFSSWNSSKQVRFSFATVMEAAQLVGSENAEERASAIEFFKEFEDAIVLIGPVDPLLQDLATTSFDDTPVPKVGVHGNLLKTIVSGRYLQRLAPWANFLLLAALTLIVMSLAVAGGAKGVRYKILAGVVLSAYVALAFLLFKAFHVVLPLAAPLGAALTTSFAAVIWQLIVEEKQKGRIKGMFGTYLAPQVVNELIESGKDPELGGHDAEITAYFSDIQGFSGFSEIMQSGPLGELLNEYLTACTDIVQAEGGSLDKYIGDAVVAMFGAPIAAADHAYRACVVSQLVQQRIGELREKWKGEGDKWPELVHKLRARIGLNTGVCMIGNMGSRTRFNYTMMGDNVNLAARMESGAKSWGAYTMVSESTKLACEKFGGDRVIFRPLGRIVVMGRSQPVPIHEIVGLKEFVTAEMRECVELFAQGMARFYARDWNGAIACFERSAQRESLQPGKSPGVKSNPSLVRLEKVRHYELTPPPADWSGVEVMTEK